MMKAKTGAAPLSNPDLKGQTLHQAAKAVSLDPWSYTAHRQLQMALLFQWRFPGAETQRSLEIKGGRRRRLLAEVAKSYSSAGKIAEARAALKEVENGVWPEAEPAYELAVLYTALGDKDAAFRFLNQAFDRRLTRIIWMKPDPELDALHPDVRFPGIVARLGLDR